MSAPAPGGDSDPVPAPDPGRAPIDSDTVATFRRCVAVGGVTLFPTDTVYGLATEPDSREGVRRLYRLKGRPPARPAAVMFFDLALALDVLPELGAETRSALGRLLPGAVTALVPNPSRRYPLACGPVPDRLGLRVPALGGELAALAEARWPVLQTSANRSGGAEARRLEDVDPLIRRGVDQQIDGGELAGIASTVVDLTAYEDDGEFSVVREGAVAEADVVARLRG